MSERFENRQKEWEHLPSSSDLGAEFSTLSISSETSTSNSITQDSPIFDLHYFLIRTINELDHASFLKLARTCRTMHDICFHARGIEVVFGRHWNWAESRPSGGCQLSLKIENDESKPEGVNFVMQKLDLGPRFRRGILDFPEDLLEEALKMPFRFMVDYAKCQKPEEMTTAQLESFRRYLHRFRRPQLKSISLDSGTSDWNTFAEIIQEFGVKRLSSYRRHQVVTPIPENLLLSFATNMTKFRYPGYVSDEIVLTTTAKDVTFRGARISIYTFRILLERFAIGESFQWIVGIPELDDDATVDPYMVTCSEVFKIAQVESVEYIKKDPGVLYWSPRSEGSFFLLRADGTEGILIVDSDCVSFS